YQTLGGVGPYLFIMGDPEPMPQYHLWALAGGLAVALLSCILAPRRRAFGRGVAFVAVSSVVLVAQIFLTRRATGPHHPLLLSPAWLIIIAALAAVPFISDGTRNPWERPTWAFKWRRRLAIVCAMLAVLAVLTSSLRLNAYYLDHLHGATANINWDDGSYDL